nr:hypothetical protein [Paenibacillus apiarius]
MATKLIKRYSRSNVLIYADPPYLLGTRRGEMYKHEMTEDDRSLYVTPAVTANVSSSLMLKFVSVVAAEATPSNTENTRAVIKTNL